MVICFSITHFQSKNKPEPRFHYKIFHVQFLPKLIVEWKVRSFIIFLDTLYINSKYIPFLQNEKKKAFVLLVINKFTSLYTFACFFAYLYT